MTDAEQAYAAAEKEIAEAIKTSATNLDFDEPPFHALETLPREITGATTLTHLGLDHTNITDAGLPNLAQLPKLYTVSLNSTQITDQTVEHLRHIKTLNHLELSTPAITDRSTEHLADHQNLIILELRGTAITNQGIAALSRLPRLKWLDLRNTTLTDPAAQDLAKLTNLETLLIDNTDILDLRPLTALSGLTNGQGLGLSFQNTAATRADPRIAEIAEIEDHQDRTQTLFTYLETWVPPGTASADEADTATPTVPAKSPAPLQTEFKDGQLTKSGPALPHLADQAADTRSQAAWAALKEFRDDFVSGVHLDNYRPLAKAIASFDRALGQNYADMNVIALGIHGDRLIALSQNTAFKSELPDGSDAELDALAAAIDTYRNRFPDWLAYLDDAETPPSANDIAQAEPDLAEIADALANADDVDENVATEFKTELETAKEDPQIPAVRKGLIASTRDILITLSERLLSVPAKVRSELYETYVKTGISEIRKAAFWATVGGTGGVIFYLFASNATTLAALADKFPVALGWVKSILNFFGLI